MKIALDWIVKKNQLVRLSGQFKFEEEECNYGSHWDWKL
jgi:hypothetical protein